MKKITCHASLLIFIVLLGLIVRVYKLDSVPFGFFCDEASIGYNAYSILTTGHDEYGISYPVFFQAFGEYKGPIEIYSTVPFIQFFGLNEFSVRLPSALFGIFGIITLYFLVKEMSNHENNIHDNLTALIAALFLAISPWHIHFSRIGFELMPFLFFTLLGLLFFFKAQKKPLLFFLWILCFCLAFYSYSPARLFIPFLSFFLICIYFSVFIHNKRALLFPFLVLVFGSAPFFLNLSNGQSIARWKQVSIFDNPPKNESISSHIVTNYLEHFSPDFLFIKGDIGMSGQFITRHSIRGFGELYKWQLPLILLGLVFLFKKQKKLFLLCLCWLIIYPVGTMFTTDQTPQATRSVNGVVLFTILSAYGVTYLITLLQTYKKNSGVFIIVCMCLVSLFSLLQFSYALFIKYPLYSSDFWGWQYGAKNIVTYFVQHKNEYDDEIMQPEFNAPDIFFKFYAPHNCQKCLLGTPDSLYNKNRRQLFAVSQKYLREHRNSITSRKTIYYPNHTVAFIIGEIVK